MVLRRLPKLGSSRGGVLSGERRMSEARAADMGSSSNARFRAARAVAGLLIVTGTGARWLTTDAGDMRIGEDTGRVELEDALGVLGDDAEADIGEVWGSLGPLLNGLKSHEGVNFDAMELRELLSGSR